MAGGKIPIGNLADEIMKGMQEYADLCDADVKAAVKKSAKYIKSEIVANAPERPAQQGGGKYKASWATKTVDEKTGAITQVIHSKNRYQIVHLLEHGHAKRNGGRVEPSPRGGHVAPAEEKGIQLLENEIKKRLKSNG